jgi:tRNA-specific 2-thiouridylase
MPSFKPLKIIVGLSGGVDSSVSALLLKQQGHDVEGIFMKNWEDDDTDSYCSAEEDIKDAQSVCDTLGIKLNKVNFAQEYWDNVFTHFLNTYKNGQTPNPDILCNKEIKFKLCLNYAFEQLGADYFATGHYAQSINNQLIKAADATKDQTYFLYMLTSDILSKIKFPIGHLQKSDVRNIAMENQLVTHNKKDSTGICFIGERKFKRFLSRYLPAQKGIIETPEGKQMGEHDGLMYYTIGQREGIKIGGQREGTGKPFYVSGKDLQRNVLIIAQGHQHPSLLSKKLIFNDPHWIHPLQFPLQCFAKIRYRQQEVLCEVTTLDHIRYNVSFDSPQWAISPGQSIVLYQKELCLGGGIIIENV